MNVRFAPFTSIFCTALHGSPKCQDRTSTAVQQIAALFDDVVGLGEERRRHSEA
jgi:hypothetical protein